MNVTEWSIYQDDPLGVTVHWVDRGIDTGAIAATEQIDVRPGATLESLRTDHQAAAARLLISVVRQVADGSAPATPQAPEDGRQYYRMHPHLRRVVEASSATGTTGAERGTHTRRRFARGGGPAGRRPRGR